MEQGYNYQCETSDLDMLSEYERVAEEVNADNTISDELVAEQIQQAGLSRDEMMWLVCLHSMSQEMRQRIARTPPTAKKPYQPFAERIQALERSMQFDLVSGILDYSEDAELLTLPEMTRSNPLWLIQTEEMMGSYNAHLYEVEQEENGEEQERSEHSQQSHVRNKGKEQTKKKQKQKRSPLVSAGLPSQVTDLPWIYALPPRQSTSESSKEQRGHWRIDVPRDHVDDLWRIIALAVQQGTLGIGSRVSTLSGSAQLREQQHIIRVYTANKENEADVMQVRATLRELGVTWPIAYKLHGPRPANVPEIPGHDAYTLYYK